MVLDTGSKYESLKFKAELIKAIGLAFASPFGAIIIESLIRGIDMNWYLPIKLLIAMTSFLSSSFLLSLSYSIMEDREWRIEREIKRIQK